MRIGLRLVDVGLLRHASCVGLGLEVAVDRTIGDSCFIVSALDNDFVLRLQFNNRQKNIQYLCETPVLLEKRLYGIAQMLQAKVE